MPDGKYLPGDTLVQWLKTNKGKPSNWSTDNNYGIPGTVQGNLQIRQRDQFIRNNEWFTKMGHAGFAVPDLVMTTAKEFMDEMKKYNLLAPGH